MRPLQIDSGYGEGGGQLCRCAMALAAITGRPIHLENIRARRARPGLKAQHLTALQAVAAVSCGELEGGELGATEIRFRPGPITGGDYHFMVGTAGSVTLVLQAVLPVALHAERHCRITITGGTDVKMAPPVDYLRLVFLPWLARMGAGVRLDSVRHGYYPRGNGAVSLTVSPSPRLNPLVAERPGRLRLIRGLAHVARLPLHIPERMAAAAAALLTGFGPIQIETRVLPDAEAFGTGGALVLVAERETSLLGAAAVAERGVPAEKLGAEAGHSLRAELEAGAAMDIHAADQLLIYAALTRGPSRFAVRQISRHARTVMWLIERFLPVRFHIESRQNLQIIETIPHP